MALYRFKKSDLFYNRVKTYPQIDFSIYDGAIYYNNKNFEPGAFTDPVLHMPPGHISLYEMNVDRPAGQLIYPFITKDGSITSFRTVSTTSFNTDFDYGDEITGSYPLIATISTDPIFAGTSDRKMPALRNTINFYRTLSPQFEFSNAFRDLGNLNLNLISIPSIFFGSSIRKGSIDLKFYVTGTLIGHVTDRRRNGELIQVAPAGSPGSGSIVGLALYNEGFLILTGSTALSTHSEVYPPSGIPTNPTWFNFGVTGSAPIAVSSSFTFSFEGTNYIPTVTMLAHASQGEINHSNNYTFLDHDSYSGSLPVTGALVYQEPEYNLKNTVQTPYNDPTGSFERQTYISRIGIYDKDKNLIGIAKVATPVKKRETDSYTFKLKLDF